MYKQSFLIIYLITILSCSFFEDEEDKQVQNYSNVQTPSKYQENTTSTPQKTNTENTTSNDNRETARALGGAIAAVAVSYLFLKGLGKVYESVTKQENTSSNSD